MNKLTDLQADAFGISYDLEDLPGVLVAVGDNGVGKTVLLSLPGLALSGPQRGDEGPWSIVATWDTPAGERRVERYLDKTGHRVAYRGNNAVRGVDSALRRDIGEAWAFDAHAWASESGRKRTEPLRDYLRFDWSVEKVRGVLQEAGVDLQRLDELAQEFEWTKPPRRGQSYIEWLVDQLQSTWRGCNARTKSARAGAEAAQQRMAKLELPSGTIPQWQDRIDKARARRDELNTALGEARARAKQAEADERTLATKRAELEALDLDEEGARGVWKRAQVADAEVVEKLADLREKLAKANEELDAARELVATERVDQGVREHPLFNRAYWLFGMIVRESDDEQLNEELWAWINAANVIRERTDDVEALESKVIAHRRIRDRIEAAVRELDRRDLDAPKALAHLHSLEDRRKLADSLRADIEELSVRQHHGAEVGTLREQLDALDREIAGYQAKLDALNDSVQLRAQVDAASDTVQTLKVARDTVTEYGKAARAVYGRMATEATQPLVEPADRITRATLDVGVALDIDDGTTLLLGGKPIDQCSQSQRTIALAAFQTAVQMQMPGWRALILDGMEQIEQNSRTRFLDALVAEVEAGNLDNVLAACVDDGWRWRGHPTEGHGTLILP